jgi:hypothetical protein
MTRPPDLGRPRKWTDDDLRRAVLGPPPASSLFEITRRLGIRQGGPTNRMLRAHAERLSLTLPTDARLRRQDPLGDVENATRLLNLYAPERLAEPFRAGGGRGEPA